MADIEREGRRVGRMGNCKKINPPWYTERHYDRGEVETKRSVFNYDPYHFTLILPASQPMTSQIRSRVDYLIPTYNSISLLLLRSNLMENLASLTVFDFK